MLSPGKTLILVLWLALAATAEECWLCRKTSPPYPLTTFFYTEARSVRHPVCETCMKGKSKCDVCGGPTNAKQEVDGRFICPECKKVAIDSKPEMDAIYLEVQRFVEGLTGLKVDRLPPVMLVMSDEMDTRFAEGSGRSFRAHAFYQPYNPELIYVLSGHSAYDLGPTLAHEFTHAWQSRHCPQQDRMLKEGFASWVAYKYAEARGYREQMNQMKRARDPDYGEGLRRCLEIEKKSGIRGVVEFVRKASNFDS
jgi:hypothetical protein